MPIDNPRFLEAGAAPGEARGWRLVARVTTVAVAAFDARGWEAFAWAPLVRALGPGSVVVAALAGERVESFDAWARGAATSLGDVSIAAARWTEGGGAERFGAAPLVGVWTPGQPVATFADGAWETFAVAWPGMSGRAGAWDEVVAAPAVFGAGGHEGFTGGWPLV